jgi:hypothetical protein
VREVFADVPIAMIDPYDLDPVAALALTSGGHNGQSYRLTGPEPLLPADRAAILGAVLGRDPRLVAEPDDDARRRMGESMPDTLVDAFFQFFSAAAATTTHTWMAQPAASSAGLRAPSVTGLWPTRKRSGKRSTSTDPADGEAQHPEGVRAVAVISHSFHGPPKHEPASEPAGGLCLVSGAVSCHGDPARERFELLASTTVARRTVLAECCPDRGRRPRRLAGHRPPLPGDARPLPTALRSWSGADQGAKDSRSPSRPCAWTSIRRRAPGADP